MAAREASAAVQLPAGLAGVNVESTDGTFDRVLRAGKSVRSVRATEVDRLDRVSTATLASRDVSEVSAREIWLVPSARYHVHELGPLGAELSRREIPWAFVCTSAPGEGLLHEISRWAPTYRVMAAEDLAAREPRAIVLMNDWGLYSDLVANAAAQGVPTFAKVEGAQDFKNRDTLRLARPYQSADYIMCQGPYDLQHIGDRGVIVGSCRLEGLLALRTRNLVEPAADGYVVANYNFSYGTREYAADGWLRTVGAASRERALAVSVHPAVETPPGFRACPYPLAFELERASRFVTRASTALFDAVALGTPACYFTPHRERCWDDLEFASAVPRIRSESSLRAWIASSSYDEVAGTEWLTRSFLSVSDVPSEVRMADLVLGEA